MIEDLLDMWLLELRRSPSHKFACRAVICQPKAALLSFPYALRTYSNLKVQMKKYVASRGTWNSRCICFNKIIRLAYLIHSVSILIAASHSTHMSLADYILLYASKSLLALDLSQSSTKCMRPNASRSIRTPRSCHTSQFLPSLTDGAKLKEGTQCKYAHTIYGTSHLTKRPIRICCTHIQQTA